MLRVLSTAYRFLSSHPLVKRSPMQALSNVVRWQAASLVWGGELVVPWIGGTRLVVQRGMVGATGNLYTGLHEFREMGFLLHFLRREDLFADVGANIGSYSVLAGGVIGARVVALEPVPETFARLVRNVSVNDMADRVRAIRVAASAESSTVRFTADLDAMNRALTDTETHPGKVEVVAAEPLDSLLAEAPTLMKIDVEGYEQAVLLGAQRVFADSRLKAIIIEVLQEQPCVSFGGRSVPRHLADQGWLPCVYDPLSRSLVPDDRKRLEGNLIMVRDLAEARDRVRRSQPFVALGITL